MTWLLLGDGTGHHLDAGTFLFGLGLLLVVFALAQLVAKASRSDWAVAHMPPLTWWWPIFRPDTEAPYRPDPNDPTQREAVMYVRSILVMRIFVGIAGVLLPIALLVIDRLYFHGHPKTRDSMSAYYWSGMHDVFVTIIFGTGAFLVGYKIVERTLDNTASIVAGLGALCLAWFPTKPGPDCLTLHNTVVSATCKSIPFPVLTPLEQHWTPTKVWYLHVIGTGLFVVGLAIVSYLFGVREGKWPSKAPGKHRSPRFWRRFHKTASLFMVWGILFILLTSVPHHRFGPDWDVLIGEVTCAWAFGASWLSKGWEWDTLRGRTVSQRLRPDDSTENGDPPPPE